MHLNSFSIMALVSSLGAFGAPAATTTNGTVGAPVEEIKLEPTSCYGHGMKWGTQIGLAKSYAKEACDTNLGNREYYHDEERKVCYKLTDNLNVLFSVTLLDLDKSSITADRCYEALVSHFLILVVPFRQ